MKSFNFKCNHFKIYLIRTDDKSASSLFLLKERFHLIICLVTLSVRLPLN